MSNNFSISYVLKESFEILNKRRKYAVYPLVVLEMICGGMVPVLMVYVPKIIVDILEKQDMTWDNLKIIPTFLVGAMVVAIISLLCNPIINVYRKNYCYHTYTCRLIIKPK